jgi:hypothetical protein
VAFGQPGNWDDSLQVKFEFTLTNGLTKSLIFHA